jgi:hypothetical protein
MLAAAALSLSLLFCSQRQFGQYSYTLNQPSNPAGVSVVRDIIYRYAWTGQQARATKKKRSLLAMID